MNGINARFFLDTNTIVNVLRGHSIHQIIDNKILHTSFIVELECLSKPILGPAEVTLIQNFFNDEVIVHEYDSIIKNHVLQIRRSKILKLPDAIIAATALKLNIPIVTADSDFAKVPDLNVVLYHP